MDYLFEQPVWLWLAAGMVPVVLVGLWGLRAMIAARRWVAIVIRCVLLMVLIAALAGLSIRTRTNKVAVVAVVDVSGSTRMFYRPWEGIDGSEGDEVVGSAGASSGEGVARFARWYLSRAASRLGEEDLVGVVVFDGSAAVVGTPARARVWERDLDLRVREGSNIAEALRLARAIVPPDATGRIVLMSDGNQTAGDALGALREASTPVPVHVLPLSYALENEVVVESVDAPPSAAGQSTISVRVVLASTRGSTGTLTLLREGQAIDLNGSAGGVGRRVRVPVGRSVEVIEVPLPAGRVHRFRAVFEPDPVERGGSESAGVGLDGDTIVQNNEGESFTITPGRGRVLLVDGSSAVGAARSPLAQTLRDAGIDVEVQAPGMLSTSPLALEAYDMLVLENVPAESVSTQQQEELIVAVRDLGLGLTLVGGREAFGAGGWKGSPLAAIMPVELQLPDTVVAPQTATVLVMDNSGSMNMFVLGSTKSQMQIANDAAAMAIGTMDRHDLVSVVVFNSNADVLVPLTRVGDGKSVGDRVRRISAGGGTNMAAGLEEAIDQLRGVQAKVKHLIVLSDGKSQRSDDLPGLVDLLAGMDAKVSTIAVGNDADLTLLARLAERSGGTHYYVSNPRQLPRIFLKAVRVLRAPLVREARFSPVLRATGSPMIAGIEASNVPALGGLSLTQARPEETIQLSMISDKDEPVLASWNVGLGQVVAFTSDAGEWASEWLSWPGYQRLWTQIVRSASRPPSQSGVLASASVRGDRLVVRASVSDASGVPLSGLRVPATIYSPSGEAIEAELEAVGVGEYEASIPASESGSYVGLVRPTRVGEREGPLSAAVVGAAMPRGSEYRALRSDDALLAEIARASGGRVLDARSPETSRLFDREGVVPAEAISPLTKSLLAWAVALLLLDIAARRVAWDRWVSTRLGALGIAEQERAMREQAARASAVGGVASLRRASESVETRIEASRATTSLSLSDQDARDLAIAARDRRRETMVRSRAQDDAVQQQRLPDPAPTSTTEAPVQPEGSGLLAAKRRAGEKYRDR